MTDYNKYMNHIWEQQTTIIIDNNVIQFPWSLSWAQRHRITTSIPIPMPTHSLNTGTSTSRSSNIAIRYSTSILPIASLPTKGTYRTGCGHDLLQPRLRHPINASIVIYPDITDKGFLCPEDCRGSGSIIVREIQFILRPIKLSSHFWRRPHLQTPCGLLKYNSFTSKHSIVSKYQ